MSHRVIWNGTSDEALALLHALQAHCACKTDTGRIVAVCEGHFMLAHDQRAMDGLVFMRRMAAQLLSEEFHVQSQGTEKVAASLFHA